MMKLNLINVEHLPAGGVQLPNRLGPFLWYFLRQAKWQLLVIMLLFTLSTVSMSLTSYFIKIFVDILGQVENRSSMWEDIIWVATGWLGICVVLQSVFWRTGNYIKTRTLARFANMVRRQLFVAMSRHSYAFFQNDYAGRLSSKVMETPYALRLIVDNFVEGFIYSLVTFIVSFFLLAMTGWEQLLILGGLFLIYAGICGIIFLSFKNYQKLWLILPVMCEDEMLIF
ncbi:MAG: ABC transporter ATP-binding protein [Rhodospirillales bacterium]|nr:ABC transporter ATP-binding protein [Rhodospirillales bacterium]